MSTKRKIEIFSAGCPACDEVGQMVTSLACPSCDVVILDMHQLEVAAKSRQYGVRSVPSVVIDGRLADCCRDTGADEATLRAAGLGAPLP